MSEVEKDKYYTFEIDTNQDGKSFAYSLFDYLSDEEFTYIEEFGNVIENYNYHEKEVSIELRKNFTPSEEFHDLIIKSIKTYCENYYNIVSLDPQLRVKKIGLKKIILRRTEISTVSEEIKTTIL